jgi:soluble lytic murein transglycosylase-like protein
MASLSIPQMIQNVATSLGVPPALAVQVATQESGLNPNALGTKGEVGLFQVMPSLAASMGLDPSDPVQNTQVGVSYLAQLYEQFGDWATALAAYNWGPGNVSTYGAAAAPASTQAYVSSALSAAGIPAPGAAASAPTGAAAPSLFDDAIDLLPDGSALQPAAASPGANILLLTFLGLGAYFLFDLFLGERG